MKKIIFSLLMLVSASSFGVEFSGNIIDALDFENLSSENMSSENMSKAAAYPYPGWRAHPVSCQAFTYCPNGRRVFCQVYGFNYSRVPSRFSNSCRFMVLPGRGVRCQGYSMQRDFYGNTFWSYVDIPVSCF